MRFIILLGFLSVTTSRADEDYHPSPYQYEYKVQEDKQHLDFGHEEKGDGSGAVHGSYHVQLPDGRLQHVSYTVSGLSGYVATVSYDGKAAHPAGDSYGHGYRKGKSVGNAPSFGASSDFPVVKQNSRSGKSQRPSSVLISLQRSESGTPNEDTLETVFGSVFREDQANHVRERPSITFAEPTNERFEFTPVFSSPANQPGQTFGSQNGFQQNRQTPQPVRQNFLFPNFDQFQNLPPNQFVARNPQVKTTVIAGKSGFRSSNLPKREASDYVYENKNLEEKKKIEEVPILEI